MVSIEFVNYVIEHAEAKDLKTFVKEVLKSVLTTERWDDTTINNALELITGCGTPYDVTAFSDDKIMGYIKRCAYKGENSDKWELVAIDNFKCTVVVKYNEYPEGELIYDTTIGFKEIFANVKD